MRTVLLASLACLALVAPACGGDDDLAVATPETTPDLTVPSAPADAGGDDDQASTTSTGASTTGEPAAGATGGTPADGAAGGTATPAPATPAAPATPPASGGTPDPDSQPAPAQPEETGGAEAGGTSDFCAENPGAC